MLLPRGVVWLVMRTIEEFLHRSNIHSFIKSHVTYRTFTIKVQVIRNMAYQPSMQASYTICSGMTMQENQPAAQIAARHDIFSSDSAIYVMNLFGTGGN